MSRTATALQEPDIEDRIYRKVVLKVVPLITIGFFIAYIDRSNLGVIAKPMSLDLGLTASSFALGAGFFYIGYVLFEIPSNMILSKVGARFWLGRIMVTWGIVTIAMGFMQNEVTFYIMRFLLGVAEAGYSPGVILYLALWCTPRHMARATTVYNLSVPVALAFGSMLTSVILLLDGTGGLAGWRWAFIIEGIPAVIMGIYFFYKLPSKPSDAAWLDAEEKSFLAANSVQASNVGGHAMHNISVALRRPSLWMFTLTYFCALAGFWAITYFLPTIIASSFKLGVVQSGMLSAIPWTFSILVMLIVARTTVATGDRKWHLSGLMAAAAIGLFLGVESGNPVLELIGISIAAAGFFGLLSTLYTTVAQVYAGPTLAVSLAFYGGFSNLSGLAGPYILGVLVDATGSTSAGLVVMSCFFAVAAVLVFIMLRWADGQTGGLAGHAKADGRVLETAAVSAS